MERYNFNGKVLRESGASDTFWSQCCVPLLQLNKEAVTKKYEMKINH